MVSFGGVLGQDSLGQFDFSVRLGLFRLCIMGLFVSGSTMVYGRYNELVNGVFSMFYKPTFTSLGGPSCRGYFSWDVSWDLLRW